MHKNFKYLFFILLFSSRAVKPDVVIGKLKVEYDKMVGEKKSGLGHLLIKPSKKVGLVIATNASYKNYKKGFQFHK